MLKGRLSRYTAIALAGATLLAGALKGWNDYTSTPTYVVNSLLSKTPIRNKERIILFGEKRRLEKTEIANDLEEILAKAHRGKQDVETIEMIQAVDYAYINPEKRNLTSQIERLGNDSREHLFTFINSPYLEKRKLHFSMPKKREEIKEESTNGIDVYIVEKTGVVATTDYKIKFRNGQTKTPTIKKEINNAGQTCVKYTCTRTETGFMLNIPENPTPILYSTTGGKIGRAEAIAIEALHNAIRPYKVKQMRLEAQNIGKNEEKFKDMMTRWNAREEAVVHGIATLWLPEYNRDRQLGISQEEITEKINSYAHRQKYQYVENLIQMVQQIGPTKAVELYATDPESLFRELEKK